MLLWKALQHGQKNPAYHFMELSMSMAKESSRWVPAQGQGEGPELPRGREAQPCWAQGCAQGCHTSWKLSTPQNSAQAAVARATRKDGSDVVAWASTSLTLKSLLHLMALEWPIHHSKGATRQNLFCSLQMNTSISTKKLLQRCNSSHMSNPIRIVTCIF